MSFDASGLIMMDTSGEELTVSMKKELQGLLAYEEASHSHRVSLVYNGRISKTKLICAVDRANPGTRTDSLLCLGCQGGIPMAGITLVAYFVVQIVLLALDRVVIEIPAE